MEQANRNEHHNAAHLSFIQTSVTRSLTVFVPTLYRFLPREYVEHFLNFGSLRLSSVNQFRKHADEYQGDKHEGGAMVVVNDPVADRSMFAFNITSSNAYVLSFTTKSDGIGTSFGECAFEIFEPIGLCAEIANEIPGCLHMMMGNCIYADERILASDQTVPKIDDLMSETEPEKVDLNKMMQATSRFSGPKEHFLKHQKYIGQMEYRMIWETNRPVTEPLTVKIQNPERFCRKVT